MFYLLLTLTRWLRYQSWRPFVVLLVLLLQPLPIASWPGLASVGVVGPLRLSGLVTSRKIIDAS